MLPLSDLDESASICWVHPQTSLNTDSGLFVSIPVEEFRRLLLRDQPEPADMTKLPVPLREWRALARELVMNVASFVDKLLPQRLDSYAQEMEFAIFNIAR